LTLQELGIAKIHRKVPGQFSWQNRRSKRWDNHAWENGKDHFLKTVFWAKKLKLQDQYRWKKRAKCCPSQNDITNFWTNCPWQRVRGTTL
jgi:hypothetical protein